MRDPEQPLLVSRPTEKDRRRAQGGEVQNLYLLPELCTITGNWSTYLSHLNYKDLIGCLNSPTTEWMCFLWLIRENAMINKNKKIFMKDIESKMEMFLIIIIHCTTWFDCHLFIGLSDQVRSDFRVMQDLAVHTRIDPQQRVKTLQTFAGHINK